MERKTERMRHIHTHTDTHTHTQHRERGRPREREVERESAREREREREHVILLRKSTWNCSSVSGSVAVATATSTMPSGMSTLAKSTSNETSSLPPQRNPPPPPPPPPPSPPPPSVTIGVLLLPAPPLVFALPLVARAGVESAGAEQAGVAGLAEAQPWALRSASGTFCFQRRCSGSVLPPPPSMPTPPFAPAGKKMLCASLSLVGRAASKAACSWPMPKSVALLAKLISPATASLPATEWEPRQAGLGNWCCRFCCSRGVVVASSVSTCGCCNCCCCISCNCSCCSDLICWYDDNCKPRQVFT